MADYYPLIARAIAGLDPSAPGESRRALYERARSALIAQLRGVQPPLSESEITRERLALEEAVRKVESEAAQRAREASRSADQKARGRSEAPRPDAPRPDAPRPDAPRPGDSLRAGGRPKSGDTPADTKPGEDGAPPPPPRPREESPLPRNLRVEIPRPGQPSPLSAYDDVPPGPSGRDRQPPPQRGQERPPSATSGMRGFRDLTADVDDLGRAAAEANRQARKTYANVTSPSPEFDRLEPSMENRGDPEQPYSYDESPDEAARYQSSVRPRPEPKQKPKRVVGAAFPVKSALAIGVVLVLIGAAFLWGPSAWSSLRAMLTSQPAVVEAPKDVAPTSRPKIADRVGQPSSMDQVAPVAQRVVLYDEDPSDPKGKQYVGTVVWRTEQIKGSGGKPGDIAVRADVEIAERKFKMSMSFRRNTDASLPASHTAELTFVLPADFAGGGVSNVPGILMKSNEQARGTPLAGLAVKVTDGFFLVGLSNVDADRARNLQLLKERSWFDIPLVYSNQRRAIIAIEKGSPGERAFSDAFTSWGE
ncbi:hypothetical protein HNR60_001866 [Rhodopseudomonas rhenobacensis]|uniref:Uncharacterized protein n=1 Tax=Rhodopseudomonas rhenobacensis TaxID=87461 RepID=A0A7W7Z379_9BRAD|nr:hypothetical protein [Rhodopseudomonas rhenobacensis]MBB5047114.1 hypothetical protein [Rhodopseudomonas rhenobacensis]